MIVAEARSWIGTPYRHQHSVKHQGCDCLGLLRGVYRNVVGEEPAQPPAYSPSWGEAGKTEYMLDAAKRYLTPAVRARGEVRAGDVLVFRMRHGMIAKHCAIATGDGTMVHANSYSGAVVECPIDDKWLSKIAGVFEIAWQK